MNDRQRYLTLLGAIGTGKTFMPTLLLAAMSKNYQVNVCPVHEYWLDVGRPETLMQAHQEWSRVPHYP